MLASGGHYVFSVWNSKRHNPAADSQGHRRPIFPVDPPRFAGVAYTYHQIDPVRDLLDSVGFAGVNVSVVSMQKVVEDVYSLARGQIYGSPLFDEFRRRGVDAQRVVDALTETLLREFGSQPTPLRAIVFEARRP